MTLLAVSFSKNVFAKSSPMNPEITDVNELCKRIAHLILEANPDVVSIEEGPSSLSRMEAFNTVYLGARYQCFG